MSELQNLFNEKTAPAGADLEAVEGVKAPVAKLPSPTALELDKWGLRRGQTVLEQWQEQGVIAPGTGDADAQHNAPDANVVADAHGALFEPEPTLAENPQDAQRAAWFKQLMETPEHRALHNQTVLDDTMSAIGAKSIVDAWTQYASEQPEPKPGDPAPGSDGEPIGDTIARLRSTGKALQQAKQDVQDAADTAAGLGMGSGGSIDPQKLAEAFKRVRSSDFLRRVMKWAGRGRARARSLQRQKLSAHRGEITGVELSGDIARLLALEQAQVAGVMPETELVSLYRLAQRRSLSYRHKISTPVQGGPIVVGVDESGSMSGAPIEAAKGLAMTLAWIAREQNRWVCFYSFCDGLVGDVFVQSPRERDTEGLFAWLSQFNGGGTTLTASLETVPSLWPKLEARGMKRGKTDHIIITDAQVHADAGMIAGYKSWAKREQVKTYGLVLGCADAGALKQVCDRHWCLPELKLDSAAVESVLSI